MSTEKFNCVFRDYPETIELSKKRRAKLYLKSKGGPSPALPKKIQTAISAGQMEWIAKPVKSNPNQEALYDRETKEFVVKNIKTVGTPRVITINSQIAWESGSGSEWTIRALKVHLAAWFTPLIVQQLPEKIIPGPGKYIHLEYIFYFPFTERDPRLYQDYLNHWFIRGKVFEDTLVALHIIPDDGPKYIRGAYPRYVNVETEAERRLEVKFHFCYNHQRIEQ